jgi:hypothetical protein
VLRQQIIRSLNAILKDDQLSARIAALRKPVGVDEIGLDIVRIAREARLELQVAFGAQAIMLTRSP